MRLWNGSGSVSRALEADLRAARSDVRQTRARFIQTWREIAVSARPRVLIVEDDRDFGETLGRCLEDAGLRVVIVATAAAARQQLDAADFQAVVSDCSCGFNLRDARQRQPDARIVIMSGSLGEKVAREAQAQGADAWFSKPFDVSLLLDAIRAG